MDKDMELLKGFPVLDIEKQPEKLAKFKKKTDKCYQELKMCQGSSYFTPPGIILIHPPGGRVG
jgi:hypothetical protein